MGVPVLLYEFVRRFPARPSSRLPAMARVERQRGDEGVLAEGQESQRFGFSTLEPWRMARKCAGKR
jgi:hypothetical protein